MNHVRIFITVICRGWKRQFFFIFYSALDILTIAIKITLTDFKNRNRIYLTKVTAKVTKI